MSRDYQQDTSDAERMQEQIERTQRWLELKDAAREILKDPESRNSRLRLMDAIDALDVPR